MSLIAKKKLIAQDIQNNFQNAKAIIFYNFHQTEERDIFQLKRKLKQVGSYWKVYKNNLVGKALPDYSLELKQANAIIFCQEDEYKPLSILKQFNQEHSSIKRFQGGIYEQKLVNQILLESWANLPSKEVLINNLCYYLTWEIRKLIKVLEKIKESKI